MKHEVIVTPGIREPEIFNRCDFCKRKEHISTQGIVSVNPKYEDLWFCCTYCLHTKKNGKNKTNLKSQKNNK